MPIFLTIGYGDEVGYRQTTDSLRIAADERDTLLASRGSIIGVAGAPVQVRNHDDAGVVISDGAFLRSDLPVAGFALLETEDLGAAIELVAGTPCAVARGVVEVWPLLDSPT